MKLVAYGSVFQILSYQLLAQKAFSRTVVPLPSFFRIIDIISPETEEGLLHGEIKTLWQSTWRLPEHIYIEWSSLLIVLKYTYVHQVSGHCPDEFKMWIIDDKVPGSIDAWENW